MDGRYLSRHALQDAQISLLLVSSVALLLYDYALTLSLEVDLVWRAPWNLLKLFYIVQRYLPFFDTAFLVLHRTSFIS